MFSRFVVVLDNLSEFTEPSVEWCKIRFVINCRLVHVVKYLLCNQIGSGEHSSLQPTSREPVIGSHMMGGLLKIKKENG